MPQHAATRVIPSCLAHLSGLLRSQGLPCKQAAGGSERPHASPSRSRGGAKGSSTTTASGGAAGHPGSVLGPQMGGGPTLPRVLPRAARPAESRLTWVLLPLLRDRGPMRQCPQIPSSQDPSTHSTTSPTSRVIPSLPACAPTGSTGVTSPLHADHPGPRAPYRWLQVTSDPDLFVKPLSASKAPLIPRSPTPSLVIPETKYPRTPSRCQWGTQSRPGPASAALRALWP